MMNKLLLYFSKIQAKELPKLEAFVRSPFFNSDQAVLKMMVDLIGLWPDLPEQKEELYALAYPNEPYDAKEFRYLISNSAALISRFWSIQSYEKNKPQMLLDQMTIYSEKELDKSYRQTVRKWEVLENKSKSNFQDWYWYDLRFKQIKEVEFGRKKIRHFDQNITSLVTALDKYYYLHRLSSACSILDRQAIFKDDNTPLPPDWFSYLKARNLFEDPLIETYYVLWEMLNYPEEKKHFEKFLLQLNLPELGSNLSSLRPLYLAAVNYSLRKLRQGKQEYREIALQLYSEAIERKILIENGVLSPWSFGNVVKLATQLHRYDWAIEFIETKVNLLPDSFKKDALHFNLAQVNYVTKDFEAAQNHLLKVSYSDLNYYLGARILLSKIYFELNDEEPLLSLISSFTIFLKRNKDLSPNIKNSCLGFCDVLYQLIRKHNKHFAKLEAKIKEMPFLAERDWLMLRWSELEVELG